MLLTFVMQEFPLLVFPIPVIQLGVFVVLLTQPRVFADHDPLTQPGVFDSLITLL